MSLRRFFTYVLIGLTFAVVALSVASPAEAIPAEINKSFSPTIINPGQTTTLTIQLFNPNPFDLTSAAVADNLPAGMTVADPNNLTNTCGGTVAAVPGTGIVALTGGTIPLQAGTVPGTCIITVSVTTRVQGNSINTILANTLTTAQGETNSTPASATLTVRTMASPVVSKSFTPLSTISVGQTTNLRIFMDNRDTSITMTGVSITDNLPVGVTIAGTPTLTNCGAGATATTTLTSVTLLNATVLPSPSCVILVPVTSTVAGEYDNTIPANAITSDQGVTNTGVATARLTVEDLSLVKSFTPSSIATGGTSRMRITFRNPTGTDYTGASLTDTMPAGVVIAAPPNAASTCGGSLATGVDTITITGGTIPAGTVAVPGECIVEVDVTASAAGIYDNLIPVGSVTTTQGATNVVQPSATLTVSTSGAPNITGSKSFTPATIPVGGTSTMRILLSAPAGTALTGVGYTDNLPANVIVATSPSVTTSGCGAGVGVTANAGSTQVVVSDASIAAGGTCQVQVNVTSAVAGPYTNTIPAGAVTGDGSATNDSPLTADLDVLALEVSKAFSPTAIGPFGRSTVTITLTNYGSIPLTNVMATDNLPNSSTVGAHRLRVANPSNPSTTCGGTVTATPGAVIATLSGGTLPAAVGGVPSICTFSFDVEPQEPYTSGTATNTIPVGNVTSAEGVSNLVPATAGLRFFAVSIDVNKLFNPLYVSAGEVSTLTVQLINPMATTGIVGAQFVDNLPTGMILASPPNPNTTCAGGVVSATSGGTSFSFTGGTIPAGTTCTVSVEVTAIISGTLTNTIPAGGVTSTTGASNSQDASASLTYTPGFTVLKQFDPTAVSVGQPSTLTIQLFNVNNFTVTNITFTDNLPGSVVVATTPNSTTNCPNATVSASAGASSVGLSGADLGANASCTFTVDVMGTAAGSFTNTIPAGAVTGNDPTGGPITNPGPATDTLTVTSGGVDLQITKDDGVVTYTPGGTLTYTIVVSNVGSTDVTDATVTDTFPPAITAATWSCVPGTGASCTGSSSGNINDTVTIPVGGSITYTVNVTLGTGISGDLINIATVTPPTGTTDSTPGNNTDDDIDRLPGGGITVAKSADPASLVEPGGTVIFTVRVDNPGTTSSVTITSLMDSIYGDLTTAAPPKVSTLCTLPQTIPPGGFYQCVFMAMVNGQGGDTETDTVTASGTDDRGNPVSDSDDATVSITGPVVVYFDPAISKLGVLQQGGLGLPGESLTWEFVISNIGTGPGTDIVICDEFQTELRILSAETQRGTVNITGQKVCFSIPYLGAGESIRATVASVILTSPLDGVIENVVTMTGTGPDGGTKTASANASVPVTISLPGTGYPPSTPENRMRVAQYLIVVVMLGSVLTLSIARIIKRRSTGG